MLDRSRNRARQSRRRLFLPNVWIHLVDLPHLSSGPPAKIELTRAAQVEIGELLEATFPIEGGCPLIGDSLIVDKPTSPGRMNGLLVQGRRITFATFDAGNLRADQRSAVLKV